MVVGIHRNLEKKKKVSTAKNVLEKLDLPIANAIMTWRTLSKTISNIQPMTKLAKEGRIFGNSFSLTQTGRISMYEPNLQNVTKDFTVEFKGKFDVFMQKASLKIFPSQTSAKQSPSVAPSSVLKTKFCSLLTSVSSNSEF